MKIIIKKAGNCLFPYVESLHFCCYEMSIKSINVGSIKIKHWKDYRDKNYFEITMDKSTLRFCPFCGTKIEVIS